MTEKNPRSYTDLVADDHVSGDVNAPVTLIEYGDYQCPYCGEAYGIIKALQQSLRENLCFVYRNFPLRMIHTYSEHAAETAEAAAEAGNFWAMHDMLFEHQVALDDDGLLQYAEQNGLDAQKVAGDLATHRFFPRVQRDLLSGMRSGVNGTPTFFINGQRHNGGFQFTTLLNAISMAGHILSS